MDGMTREERDAALNEKWDKRASERTDELERIAAEFLQSCHDRNITAKELNYILDFSKARSERFAMDTIVRAYSNP